MHVKLNWIVSTALILLLSGVSQTMAASRTYALQDYPGSQLDDSTGEGFSLGIDHISGTIITDGVTGTLGRADILSVTYQVTDWLGNTYTISSPTLFSPGTVGGSPQLFATATDLSVPIGCSFGLSYGPPGNPSAPGICSGGTLGWERTNGYDLYYGQWWGGSLASSAGYPNTIVISNFVATPSADQADGWSPISPLTGPNTIEGSNSDGDAWVIATVPEPSTLVLLGSALMGLGVFYLRRHRAKA